MGSIVKENYLSELKKIDWDFLTGEGNGIYASHWYPARYIPQIPLTLIGYFSNPSEVVLDPFCGSGTTLLEATRFGRKAIGIDINPIGILMAKAKLANLSEKEIRSKAKKIISLLQKKRIENQAEFLLNSFNSAIGLSIPNLEENKRWFHPKTLKELGLVFSTIQKIKGDFKNICLCVFSGMLRALSSQERHWGYICDNVKPKKFVYKDSMQTFISRLGGFCDLKIAYDKERAIGHATFKITQKPQFEVMQGDALEIIKKMKGESVDLITTSPPYLNVTDYINSQRLSFLWLNNFDREELKKLEVGARYKRHRSNPKDEYISYMSKIVFQLARVLKNRKYACFIIGESPNHSAYAEDFEKLMKSNHFKKIHEAQRTIAQKRSLSPRMHTETIYIFRLEN